MAAGTEPTPRPWALPPIRWSAVVAGALVAIATNVTLSLVGAAVGFAADSPGLRAAAALWTLLVPVVATFTGAWLAVKLSGEAREGTAYAHGVLVWSIGLIVAARFFTVAAAVTGAAAFGALLGLGAAFLGAALARRPAGRDARLDRGRAATAEREVGAPGAFPPTPGPVAHPPPSSGRGPREPLHH